MNNNATRLPTLAGLRQWISRAVAGIALVSTATMASAAPTIQFVAVDIADVVVGHDLWRYDYTIGGMLAAGEGVNLLFSATLFDALDATFADASVLALATQPILALSADGFVSVTALLDITSADPAHVSVQFEWLGAGAFPSSQPFEVVDSLFTVIGTDRTVSEAEPPQSLPEPASFALVGAALLGAVARPSVRRVRASRGLTSA